MVSRILVYFEGFRALLAEDIGLRHDLFVLAFGIGHAFPDEVAPVDCLQTTIHGPFDTVGTTRPSIYDDFWLHVRRHDAMTTKKMSVGVLQRGSGSSTT